MQLSSSPRQGASVNTARTAATAVRGNAYPIGFDVILAIVSARQAASMTARIAGQSAPSAPDERQRSRRLLLTRHRGGALPALAGTFSDWRPAAGNPLATEINAPFTRAFQPMVNVDVDSGGLGDAADSNVRTVTDPELEH